MKFEKYTSTTDEKSHRLIILLCYTSQESPSLKRQFFKRFNKNLIMLISILVLIETSLKGNGCNLANSDRNHRNVSVTQLLCCELLTLLLGTNISWFFLVVLHIWYSPLWKIIKYYKKIGEKSSNYGCFWNQKCSQCIRYVH